MTYIMRTSVIVASLLFVGCQSSYETISLGGNRKIIVLRNAQDAYPIYASTLQVAFQGAFNTKPDVTNATFNTTVGQSVQKIYQDLDNADADMRLAVFTSYSKYLAGMSVAESEAERMRVSEAFDDMLKRTTELTAEVRKVTQQLVAAKNQTTADWDTPIETAAHIRSNAKKYLNTVGPSQPLAPH